MPVNLWVYQCNSGDGNPGRATDLLATQGWTGVLSQVIQPKMAWLSTLGEPVGIVLHLPFGQWSTAMSIDAYDWAIASRCGYFTDDFRSVWDPLCDQYNVVAYIGGLHLPEHLLDRTAYELRKLIRRNLLPLEKFDSVCLDTGSEAYTHPFTISEISYTAESNNEILALSNADAIWGEGTTAIEATPRNHAYTTKLKARDCYITETLWRLRHGLPGERTPDIEDHLYGDRDYLTGTISRFVTSGYFNDDLAATLAAAQRVVDEGDTLVLGPQILIDNNIPCTALLSTADITTGLVLCAKFDETTGTVASDSSINGNDGTLTNLDFATDGIAGQFGNGLNRTAAGEYVDFGVLGLTDADQTLACWAKLPTSGPVYYLISCRDGSVGGLSMLVTIDYLQPMHGLQGQNPAQNISANMGDDTWHHYAICYKAGSHLDYYVDGVLTYTDSALQLGTWSSAVSTRLFERVGATYAVNVSIDEVRVYSRYLAQADITQLVTAPY